MKLLILKNIFYIFMLLFLSCTGCTPASKDHESLFAALYIASNNSIVYIDPTASASGDGSISKPYNRWSQVTFRAGFSYLQKRDTVAREQLAINASGSSSAPIIIGDYGSGSAPIIQGSEIETGWSLQSGFIYRKAISVGSGGLGMVAEDGTALKFLAWNTDVTTTFGGAIAGSYSYDVSTQILYVWCTNGASPETHIMEVSRRFYGIYGANVSHVHIKNIQLQYISLHAIKFENSDSIDIENCTIMKIGGAVIGAGPLYAGNGIEFGESSSNCSVRDTGISDIFDSGISPQTYSSNQSANNFLFQNLVISRCGFAGIEVAALYNGGAVNCTIQNVIVQNSTISNCGNGWSGQRYGVEGRGIKINADISGTDTTRQLSGVLIEKSTVFANKGEGIFVGGNSGSVTIRQSAIYENISHGILVQEPGSCNILLNLNSSLIYANLKSGVYYNVPGGNGFIVAQNTLYNNAEITFAIINHSGSANLINNIFHADSFASAFFYSAVTLTNPAFDNNYFTEFGTNNIIGYDLSSYSTVASLNTALSPYAQDNVGGISPLLNPDFSLQSSSPCRSSGKSGIGIYTDFNGQAFSTPPSIGAYEYIY